METFDKLIHSEQPILVDFFAEWCGPCKTMAPVLKEVAQKMNNKARVIKVDVDKNREAALQYNVRSVPTLVIFKKGQILWRQAGVVPANKLIEMLNLVS